MSYSPKKRIIFVIESLNIGGAEKSLVSLLNILDYSKIEVSLLILSETKTLIKNIPDNVIKLDTPDIARHLAQPFQNKLKLGLFISRIVYSLLVRCYVKIENRIYLYWRLFGKKFEKIANYYDVAIGWGQGIPIFFIVDKIKASKKIGWINAFYPLTGSIRNFNIDYFTKLNKIIAVSENLANDIKKSFPSLMDKVDFIYDIINPDIIKSLSMEGKAYEFDLSYPVMLTIGRLDFRKGIDIAIEAAKILKNKGIKYKWYTIGEGGERKNLENIISKYGLTDNFILLGSKENPYPYIKECLIYVQPSRTEGFCLTLAEAKILEKPIVTTCFSTAYVQIEHEKTGIITSGIKDLASQVLNLIYNPSLRLELVKNLVQKKNIYNEDLKKFYALIHSD